MPDEPLVPRCADCLQPNLNGCACPVSVSIERLRDRPDASAELVYVVAFVVWLSEPARAWTRRDWMLAYSTGLIARYASIYWKG